MDNVSIPLILVIAGLFFILVSKVKIGGQISIEKYSESTGLLFAFGFILLLFGLITGAMHIFPTQITEYPNGTKVTIYNSNTNPESFFSPKSEIVKVTELSQINSSLQRNPVFLNIGSKKYTSCQEMSPILNELAKEYKGYVTIMYIDSDESPKLTEYFRVRYIPDSSIIVGIENNEYVYMQENGSFSKNRSNAEIQGIRDKQDLEKILDLAAQEENKKANTKIRIPFL